METSVPSFSSTLLDAIYNSIDEGDEKMVLYNETMKKKNSSRYERVCRVEKWMEKQVGKNEVVGEKSAFDFERKRLRNDNALFIKSSSSCSGSGSSDSSSGGGFSSSETESNGHGMKGSCYGLPKPKPVKKSSIPAKTEKFNNGRERRDLCDPQPKPKPEANFVRSKSRASRIYGDMKKVKQPISPGGRVSSFLNYLFAAGNTKKTKISSNNRKNYNEMGSERTPKSANASTCSTASSFSRSCLSNSRGKSNNGNKRTVRFYPVSVIVDEDCQPCGEKKLYDHDEDKGWSQVRPNAINEELKFLAMDKNRRVDKAARELLINFQTRGERDFDRREYRIKSQEFGRDFQTRGERDFDRREYRIKSQEFGRANDEDEEEKNDDESCASSDLFELDNLSAIGNGMERYRQELPVYETTRVHSNTPMAMA